MYDEDKDGASTSIIVASEPLTRNDSTWFEIQKYSMAVIDRVDGKIKLDIRDMGL